MRLPFEFSWLFVLALVGLAGFSPRTDPNWSLSVKVLMWTAVGMLALGILALKGMTGKGIDDFVGALLFGGACAITVVSDHCPSEIQRQQDKQAAQVMRNLHQMSEMVSRSEELHKNHTRPVFDCGSTLIDAKLERKIKKPFDRPIGTSFGNGESGPSATWSIYDFPSGDTIAICIPADGSAPYKLDVPTVARLCSFLDQRFECWQ